jgi:protein O-mannosyl-transferase
MIDRIFNQPRHLYLIIFGFAFILYVNTIPNDYALDDSIVITQNMYVQKGIAGIGDIFGKETFTGFFKQKKDLVEGGRYRPLSLVTFAIEQSIWKNNPHISHLINAILYGLLCCVVLICLKKILDNMELKDLAIPVSFIAALLFAVHPLHTEVVANIKGRDEILSLLFSLLAMFYVFRYFETGQIIMALGAGILLFFGLLSKENAVTMPVLTGVVIILSYNKKLKSKTISAFLFLIAAGLLYYIFRKGVIGSHSGKLPNELMNNPFLHADPSQKLATIFYTLLLYLKLLVFPHPLTYDYYPYHIKLQEWSNPLVVLSLLIYLAMIIFSVYYLIKRKYKISVLAILIYLITILPLSNLFLNAGSFMNERFVFFGSLGFCLMVAFVIYRLIRGSEEKRISKFAGYIILSVILILFSARTIVRNNNWIDNYTLFLHDVKISSGSAKGNLTAGGTLLEKATAETEPQKKKEYLDQSITYLEKSLSIYPNYVDALLLAGNAYFQRDMDFNQSNRCYTRIFEMAPSYDLAFSNYKIILASVKDVEVKKRGYLKIISYRSNDFDANCQLGSLYGKVYNNLDSAIFYLVRAVSLKPGNIDANRDLGVAYGIKGQTEKTVQYFEKTVELDPNDPSNYINLGISYEKLGRIDKANKQFMIAKELQSGKK